jgi:hypothetical protein
MIKRRHAHISRWKWVQKYFECAQTDSMQIDVWLRKYFLTRLLKIWTVILLVVDSIQTKYQVMHNTINSIHNFKRI